MCCYNIQIHIVYIYWITFTSEMRKQYKYLCKPPFVCAAQGDKMYGITDALVAEVMEENEEFQKQR